MRRGIPLLIAFLALVPPAAAGTQDAPEIRSTWGSTLAAWFEPGLFGLRFHVDAPISGTQDVAVALTFTILSTGEVAHAIVGAGGDGALYGRAAAGAQAFERAPLEAQSNARVFDLAREGSTWSGTIAWGAFDRFVPGVTLAYANVATYGFERRSSQWREERTAQSDGPYTAAIEVPAWAIGAILATCTLAGIAGGAAGWRIAMRSRR